MSKTQFQAFALIMHCLFWIVRHVANLTDYVGTTALIKDYERFMRENDQEL